MRTGAEQEVRHRRQQDEPTFPRSVCLDELVACAGFLELWREEGELGKLLVDEPNVGGEIVGVDVQGEEATDVT